MNNRRFTALITLFIVLAVLLALLGGCAGKQEFQSGGSEATATQGFAAGPMSVAQNPMIAKAGEDAAKTESAPTAQITLASMTEREPERYLIRNANVTVEVGKASEAADALRRYCSSIKGYVGNAHETVDYAGSKTVTLQIRVPYQQFDTVMGHIKSLGKSLDTQVTAEDVTEEFVDTQATLRNLKRTENRLLEHLSRTGRLSDTLIVEKELNRVREEIERREGRLRFLAHRIAFSTIDVTLREAAKVQPIVPAQSFSSAGVASEATRSLVTFAQGLWSGTIWLLVWAVVWLPLALLVIYLLRRYTRTGKTALAPPAPPSPTRQ